MVNRSKKNNEKLMFILVIPAWDRKTRTNFGIYDKYDMPILTKFIQSEWIQFHKSSIHFPFYDYLHQKTTYFPKTIPIHFIIASSYLFLM